MKAIASKRFLGPDFERLGDVEVLNESLRESLGGERPDVDAVAAMHEVIDDAVLMLLPNLRVIANYGVGYDLVDVEACARHGVTVTNTPGVVDGATADLAMALLLASRRELVKADELLRGGQWKSVENDLLLSCEVHGQTFGIVGCGRIGQAVARRAAGFDMTLVYTQRSRLPAKVERELNLEYLELDQLLGTADAVTIHTPLTSTTEGLIGASELSIMKDGACLINTARGKIVDQDALVAELCSGRLAAGLDVFADEPNVPASLFGLDNVILSPHLGTATVKTREAMTKLVVENILAVRGGHDPLTPVGPMG